jgi:hypothetical protein
MIKFKNCSIQPKEIIKTTLKEKTIETLRSIASNKYKETINYPARVTMSNKNKSKQTSRQKINKKRQKNKSLETLSPRRPFHNRPTKKNYLFQTKSLHKVRSKAIRMFSSPSYHPRWVDK